MNLPVAIVARVISNKKAKGTFIELDLTRCRPLSSNNRALTCLSFTYGMINRGVGRFDCQDCRKGCFGYMEAVGRIRIDASALLFILGDGLYLLRPIRPGL